MKRRTEHQAAIAAEIERAGVTEYEFRDGGCHPRVVFRTNGIEQMLVYAKTPSDHRAAQNNISQLRRMLGITAPKRAKSSRPTGRRRIRQDNMPAIDGLTVRADPFACLALWKPPRPKYPVTWTRTGGRTWRVEVGCRGESA